MRWLVKKASDSSPSPSSSRSTLVLIIEFCKSIFLIITIIIIIIITILQQSSGKMIIMDNLHAMAKHTAHHHHHHQHHHVSDPRHYITRPLLMKDHDVANLDNVRYKSSANRFLQFLQLHANLTKLPTNLHITRKLLGIPKQGNFTPISPSTQLVADSSLGPSPASQPISSSTRSTVFHTNTKNGKHQKPINHGNMQHNSSSSLDNNNNIDPRYGVEKRLVPTGPNPLHN